ncbi:ribonuclease BN [Streptomyces sp. NPDC059740]|uniref:ribonuclease BN n=1 Tax=Streptomyces sp. NPDC059740 TaxID=3346926 RepID=UPI0036649170
MRRAVRWGPAERLERDVRRIVRVGNELELLHRAMAFAAFGLVTIAPLLIVVAATDPRGPRGFGRWIVDGMGLSGHAAREVHALFNAPGQALTATGALSMLAVVLFGLSFAACVQTGYERIWGLTTALWHRLWRQTLWLVVLVVYLYAEEQTADVSPGGLRVAVTLVTGTLFFWWGQRMLLGSRVSWRALLPGALLTMTGLIGLREVSVLFFAPLLVTNALTYGPVGTVLVVESWLVGVGYVVFGGAALGAQWEYRRRRHGRAARALRTEDDGKPGPPGSA